MEYTKNPAKIICEKSFFGDHYNHWTGVGLDSICITVLNT